MIYSKFYYDLNVTYENMYLTFKEGEDQYTAELIPGAYSHQKVCYEISRAMSEVGQLDYTATVDRATRVITIAGTGDFELLVDIVDNPNFGQAVYPLIGYTTSRAAGATHVGDDSAGSEFNPQFPLQKYVDPEDTLEANNASVNEASGAYEIVSFGLKQKMECDIRYSNDKAGGEVIRANASGVEDLRHFMRALILKAHVEFMVNEDNSEEYYTVVLEKTKANSKGVGFKLNRERADYDQRTTGVLTFRVIDHNGIEVK